jgi:thiol-disulfide isomerase/thioredoxin
MDNKSLGLKRKIISFTVVCIISFVHSNVYAQTGKVPSFRMVQADGKIFRAENLPFGKPIIIIYFSPECDDCQKLTDELLARINEFKNASVAMITYLSVDAVSQFEARNNLKKYGNFYIGTEGNYLFVKNYYSIEQFPFIALFSKDGDLIKKYYSKEINVSDLVDHLKNL